VTGGWKRCSVAERTSGFPIVDARRALLHISVAGVRPTKWTNISFEALRDSICFAACRSVLHRSGYVEVHARMSSLRRRCLLRRPVGVAIAHDAISRRKSDVTQRRRRSSINWRTRGALTEELRFSCTDACRSVVPAIILVMLSFGVNALAQSYVNNEFQFAISLPVDQGWSPFDAISAPVLPQRLVSMASRPSGERITIQIVDVDRGASLDEQEYRDGFRNGLLKSFPATMRLVSENRARLAGVPSYELLIGGTIQNRPMNIRLVAIVANRYQYNIAGYASDAGSLTNGELARVLSSFRFTKPPMLPSVWPTLRELGGIVGTLSGYAFMVIVAALLVRLLLKCPKKA
jgi:hypothetical protein